jgi:hypothetical protein
LPPSSPLTSLSSSPATIAPSPLPSLARHPFCHHHSHLYPHRRHPRLPLLSRAPFPPPTSHLMLIVVSLLSPLPLPPSLWPSSLLVACHSRRTHHRPRHRCDRGRLPCSAMPPPAMRQVLTKDI